MTILAAVCAIQAIAIVCIVRYFLDFIETDRCQADQERQHLIAHVQAPERAATVVLAKDLPKSPGAVPFDDDDAFQEAVSGRS